MDLPPTHPVTYQDWILNIENPNPNLHTWGGLDPIQSNLPESSSQVVKFDPHLTHQKQTCLGWNLTPLPGSRHICIYFFPLPLIQYDPLIPDPWRSPFQPLKASHFHHPKKGHKLAEMPGINFIFFFNGVQEIWLASVSTFNQIYPPVFPKCRLPQGGPLSFLNGVITPISRVITPFITSTGPPCITVPPKKPIPNDFPPKTTGRHRYLGCFEASKLP